MKKFILILLIFVGTVSTLSAFGDPAPGFTNAITVSNIGDNSTAPQLIVSENNVYVAWVNNKVDKSDIFFAKSSDGGSSFGKPINLGNSNTEGADNVKIVESNGNIYAVWQSLSSGKSGIFFSKSSDGGSTFDSAMEISYTEKDSVYPQIAVSGSHVYATWLEKTTSEITNVIFSKSDDNGVSFTKPISITHHKKTSGLPAVSANGNNVYLIWEDNSLGNFDVFLAKSNDTGTTFGTLVNISNDLGDSITQQLKVDGNNVYAVWMDNTEGHYEILFSKSTDGGSKFTLPVNVSRYIQDAGYPEFTVSGNNIYVTWTYAMSGKNYDVLFAKSNDGGQTFETPINVSNDPGASGWSQIAIDGNVYVSWVDNTPGNFDIYIAKSAVDGKSFETPVDVSNTPNESWYNRMAISSNTVYLVWQEAAPPNHNIMFVKSTTFVPEFGSMVPIILVISLVSIIIISRSITIPQIQ
jgi:predicted secreted protein with PEFG-CTERM motif